MIYKGLRTLTNLTQSAYARYHTTPTAAKKKQVNERETNIKKIIMYINYISMLNYQRNNVNINI